MIRTLKNCRFLTGNRKIYYTYFNVIFTVYSISALKQILKKEEEEEEEEEKKKKDFTVYNDFKEYGAIELPGILP